MLHFMSSWLFRVIEGGSGLCNQPQIATEDRHVSGIAANEVACQGAT